jgi:hypothetical protein
MNKLVLVLVAALLGCRAAPARPPLFLLLEAPPGDGAKWYLIEARTGERLASGPGATTPTHIAYQRELGALYASGSFGKRVVRLWPGPEQEVFAAPPGFLIVQLVTVSNPPRLLIGMRPEHLSSRHNTDWALALDLAGGAGPTTVIKSDEYRLEFWQGGVQPQTGVVLALRSRTAHPDQVSLVELKPDGTVTSIRDGLTAMGAAQGPSFGPGLGWVLLPLYAGRLIQAYPSLHKAPPYRSLPGSPTDVLPSPDGTQVVYPIDLGGIGCVVVDAAGRAVVSRRRWQKVCRVSLDWAPDGAQVAFMVEQVEGPQRWTHTVYVIDPATGRDSQVWGPGRGGGVYMAWGGVAYELLEEWVPKAPTP